MKKKVTSILAIILILAALGGIITYFVISTKTYYNKTDNANGNTAGNIQNNGLFCELDGKIYFSNPFDKGRLYVMDSDCQNVEKLNDETVSSINAYGKYLYFSKNNLVDSNSTSIFRGTLFSAMRCNLNGKNLTTLYDNYSGKLVLIGNTVYFQGYESNDSQQTKGALYSVGIDKKDLKKVVDSDINPAGIAGTTFFYTGTENDHNIYKYSTKTNTSSLFFEANAFLCIPDNSALYYIDAEDNYRLKKISVSSPKDAQTIVDERISTFNVDSNYIYFQIDGDENGALCRIKKNGDSEYEIIAKGHYESINITSKYVFFYELNNESDVYRIPASGAIKIEKLSEIFDMSLYE